MPTAKTLAGINTGAVGQYADALENSYYLPGTATGTLAAGVYSSTLTLPLRKALHNPPIVLAFVQTATDEWTPFPYQVLQFDATIFGILGGGFKAIEWAKAKAYRNKVVITACSLTPYTHSYLVFIVEDKSGKLNAAIG